MAREGTVAYTINVLPLNEVPAEEYIQYLYHNVKPQLIELKQVFWNNVTQAVCNPTVNNTPALINKAMAYGATQADVNDVIDTIIMAIDAAPNAQSTALDLAVAHEIQYKKCLSAVENIPKINAMLSAIWSTEPDRLVNDRDVMMYNIQNSLTLVLAYYWQQYAQPIATPTQI